MAFKHYDVVRAASPSDLAEKLTHKLKEGWQPFGSPVAITPYTLMQAIAAEGDVVVSGATEPEWYYVIVLAGQSNAMAYGEGLPLPDSYDAPHPRIKQLARRNTVTPGGEVCVFNDIIPADHCLHDVQDTQYEVVYGAYKGKESQQIYFVPFMTDGSGVNTPTNNPSEDPDIAGSGYYGSASRTNKNWVSSNRPTHFSSWARRGIIPDRMATAILNVAGRTSAFISGKAPEIKPSPGGDTPSGPSADTSVRTISLLPTAGEAAAQGWTIKDGGIQLSGGVFKIAKQSNKAWSLTRPVDDAVSLLTRGGRLSCKFRLSGALTNNQFGLGIYLYTDVALPDVVAMTGTGNPFLMSFFTQTTDGKLNLMHHKKAGNTKLGEFGNYSNDWQTLELVFTAGSATVTPKLNGVAGPAFQVIKDSLTLGLNALTLTDITKNAAYGVEIESLVLEINAPASS